MDTVEIYSDGFDMIYELDDGNHPIIITGIDTIKDNDLILTVPPHSAGYIKTRLVVTYPHGRKGEWLENEDLSTPLLMIWIHCPAQNGCRQYACERY